MTKLRLAAIKFDKDGNISKFGYLDHNKQNVTYSGILFNSNLGGIAEVFLRGLIERHYPFEINCDFAVDSISISYEFDDPCKLTFALKFEGEDCGEMTQSFKSLPHQILERDADLIEAFSDCAIAEWQSYYDSLPKQQSLDLFAMPELENVAIAC